MKLPLFIALGLLCVAAGMAWHYRSDPDRHRRRRTLLWTVGGILSIPFLSYLYMKILGGPVPVEEWVAAPPPHSLLMLGLGALVLIQALLIKAGWVRKGEFWGYSGIGALAAGVAFLSTGLLWSDALDADTLMSIVPWALFLIGIRVNILERRVSERTRALERVNAELATANEQVREATRLKSEFLARMSHDLRTPMNAIIGYTRLLLRKASGNLDERQLANLENIQTSAHNLLDLINDILDLSKIESGRIDVRPQVVDPVVIIRECAAAVQPLVREGVEIRTQIDYDGVLTSDPDRLRRSIMNLLGNAVKFTETGHITASLYRESEKTIISVSDTGVGISADDLTHIFDEFRQVARKGSSSQEGTGLGLAIVKRSVELVGGSVTVVSEEGIGTTFTISLRDLQPQQSQGEAA